MSFKSLFFVFLLSPFFNLSAQDIILKRNGEEIKAIVITVRSIDITFKKFENAGGPDYILPISEIEKITYQNGTVDEFHSLNDYVMEEPTLSDSQLMRQKGNNDANLYYKSYKTAGTVTLITTTLYPFFGLIPAIGTSATSPSAENLNNPRPELFKNDDYRIGYKQQAKRIKQQRVWLNFGVGFGASIAFWSILLASQI